MRFNTIPFNRTFLPKWPSYVFYLILFICSDVSGQITQVGTPTSAGNSGATITITKPTGIQVGDVMFANVVQSENTGGNDLGDDISSPGWTSIDGRDFAGTSPEYWGTLLYKVAVASDVMATNYVFTLDGSSSGGIGAIVAFRGVDITGGVTHTGAAGGPFDITPGDFNGITSDNTLSASSITTISANTAILMFGVMSDNDNDNVIGWATTSPGSLTELYEFENTNGEDQTVAAAWAIKASIGATGDGTANLANTNNNGSILIALKGCVGDPIDPIAGGASIVCVGANTPAFTHPTPGGAWSTSNNAIATINGSGVATGVATGTVNVIYTVTDVDGCVSSSFVALNVFGNPSAPGAIQGGSSVCSNSMDLSFSVQNVAGVTYNWSVTGGGNGWMVTSGQGTSSITLDAGTVFPQTLSVTATNTCGGPSSATTLQLVELTSNITFCTQCNTCTEPIGNNPVLAGTCADLKVALVIDESYSIFTEGATQEVEDGVMAFVSALACTGVELAVVEFSDFGRYVINPFVLVDNSIETAMQNYFDNVNNPLLVSNADYNPSVVQYTNWQAAMMAVDALPSTPDLVVFFTDGAPTKVYLSANPNFGTDPGELCPDPEDIFPAEYENAAKVANKLKCEGAHMFVAGIGAIADNIPIIQQISGTTAYSNGNNDISNSDYATGEFSELALGLSVFVNELCPFESEALGQDLCPGEADGSIIIDIPGGFIPSDYSWFIGNNNTPLGSGTANSSPILIDNLTPNTYRVEVYVEISPTCTRTEIFFLEITSDAVAVVASVTGTVPPTCLNPDGGTATLTISIGEGPFAITLKKGGVTEIGYPIITNSTMYTAMGLDAGMYTFEVQDINTCNTDIDGFTLLAPTGCCPLTCTVNGGPGGSVCPNTQASFSVTSSGGTCTSPSYSWTIINNTTNASIVGSSTSASVNVNSGTTCGSYTIQSTLTCTGCTPLVCTQVVNVVDVTQPTITTCAVTRNIEGCGTGAIAGPIFSTTPVASSEGVFENGTNQGVASDNCGITTVTYVDVAAGTCPIVVTRTWTISDACGNSRTCNQTINVDDTILPVITTCAVTRNIEGCTTSAITGPVFSTVSASSTEAVFENGTNQGVASDECGIASVTYIDVAAGTCPIVVTRTWTISDACGNSRTCNQTINVDDNTLPVITTCAVTRNLEGCNTSVITGPVFSSVSTASTEAVFENGTNQGVASDECGITAVTYIDVAAGTCPIVVTRTWTITDGCGNSRTCNQTINVDDNTLPVITSCAVTRNIEGCNASAITGPAFSTVSASSTEAVFENGTNQGLATDECGITSVTYIDVAAGTCPIVVTRTWTISDACGNSRTCNQTINVDDNTLPVITTCAVTRNIEGCNTSAITDPVFSTVSASSTEAVFENGTNQGVASDVCGITAVTYIDVAVGTCPIVVTRTWTISDACGNSRTCNQTISVDDTTDPIITCPGSPQNRIADPGQSTYTAVGTEFDYVAISDNCGTVTATNNLNGLQTLAGYVFPSGNTMVVWTALDLCGNDATCSFTVIVDDQPVAHVDYVTTNEDVPIIGGTVVTNDELSSDGGNVWNNACMICTTTSNGTLTFNPDGTFDYIPDANYNGPDSFIYELCDIDNDCDTAIVYITITPVDDMPVANVDYASTNEDTPIIGATVVTNDMLSGDGGNTWNNACMVCTTTSNGTLTFNPDGTYDYIPDANYNGPDSFIYELCDIDNDCDTAIVYITITPVDDMPVANVDYASTNEDTQIIGATVVTNDMLSGDGGNTWNNACMVCTTTSNGTLTFNPDGTYDYIPDADYNGPDSFIYELCDIDNDCDTAIVYITITPVDDMPVANVDYASTNEDTPIIGATVVTNDMLSGDGGNVWNNACMVCTTTSNGTLTFNPDGTYDYIPDANYNGPDSFIYELCDIDNDCDTAIVYITITPVDDMPVANVDYATTNEDTPIIGATVVTNDMLSGDGGNVWNNACMVCTTTSNGTLTFNPDGTYDYVPNANYTGPDSFIYELCDIDNDCDTAIVYITIIPVNDVPTANPDTYTITTNDPTTPLPVITNDTFGGDGPCIGCTITITDPPTNGTGVVNTNGTPGDPTDDFIDYTPDQDFSGLDTLIYQICDLNNDCDTALVVITAISITAQADPLCELDAAYLDYTVVPNYFIPTGDVTIQWFDMMDNLIATYSNLPLDGIVLWPGCVVDMNGQGIDWPGWVYIGNQWVQASDGFEGLRPQAKVVFSVNPSDTLIVEYPPSSPFCFTAPPHIHTQPDSGLTCINTAIDVNVLRNDTAFSGTMIDPATLSVFTQPDNGTATANLDSTITYVPDMGFQGIDTITYVICDTNSLMPVCDTSFLYITVLDTIDPVITCPMVNSPIECPAMPVFGVAAAVDDCDLDVVITFETDSIPGVCPQEYTLIRTWTATDDAGNTATCSRTIIVTDNTPPVITCVDPVSPIECPAGPVFLAPTATDACDNNVMITFSDQTTPGTCPSEYNVTRTWTATDDCGNSSTCSRTVVVTDNTPPVITCVDPVSPIECPAGPVFLTPTATDACDNNVLITFSDQTTPGACPAEYSVTRTWTATDDCGNSSTCSRTIVVTDNMPPVITCVDPVSPIECPAGPVFLAPTATDACDNNVLITFSDQTTPGACPAEYSVTRTWTATDDCGNSATCSRTIVVTDNTPPVITCVDPVSPIECPAGPVFLAPTATDACDNDVVITFSDQTTPGACPAEYSVTRTWTATDDCGNSSTCSRTVVVTDNTPPVITCVDPVSPIECPAGPVFLAPTATDACDNDVMITFSDQTTPGACPAEYSVTRTWTATDDCGNSSTCSRTVAVTDNTPPSIVCPSDMTIECTESTLPANTGMATASDACDAMTTVTYNDVTTEGDCPQAYTIVRTWVATDDCGNSSTCDQIIEVEDTMAPVCMTQDITVMVDPATGYILITPEQVDGGSMDSCGPVTLSIDQDSFTCSNVGLNIVILTVTDLCGNSSTCTATVNVDPCFEPCVNINSWVYLEGSTTDPNGQEVYTVPMRTNLNDLQLLPGQTLVDPFFGNSYTLPGQPYNVGPWFYLGSEGNAFDSGGDPMIGDAGYPSTVTDWVLVSLRADSLGTGGPVCQAAAILHRDGYIDFVEPFECCDLNLTDSFYIVVEHRNHLMVMSHSKLPIIPGVDSSIITYDFRVQQSYIDDPFSFGAVGQKEIQTGIFAMFAGNGEQMISALEDTDINFNDRSFWEGENGDIGRYRIGDYNLNGDTNFNDRVTWERNNGKFTSTPRD